MTGRRDERGMALSVWVAVGLPAFIVAVGIGVDFSGHAAAEQEARAVAAQAARAATHEVSLTAEGPRLDRVAALRAAESFARQSGYSASVDLRAGTVAEVTVTGAYRTLFLGLIGIDTIDVTGHGSARAVSVVDGAGA